MKGLLLLVLPVMLFGCPSYGPHGGLERSCASHCAATAHGCSEQECARGCRFVLDRLVEKQGDAVVACVAKAARCDDLNWARCAARIGPHADGGPSVPPRMEEP